jgi:hypothetical protein
MILITRIETREVEDSYRDVCSMNLMKHDRQYPIAEDGIPCCMDSATYTTETVKGRRFTRSQWNDDKHEPEIISDVTIGMTADVQNVLGMQAEAWEDMEHRIEANRKRDKELCLMLENSQIETHRFTSMTRWKRIKWALFQK